MQDDTKPAHPASSQITTLQELADKCMAPRICKIPYSATEKISVLIRPVPAELQLDLDAKILAVGRPPQKEDPVSGDKSPDRDSPEFKEWNEKFEAVSKQRDISLIENGTDFKIPGNSVEEKYNWLRKNLSFTVLNKLLDEIAAISA